MMGCEGERAHKVVDATHPYGQCNAERHGKNHDEGVQSTYHAGIDIAVYHIAHKVDEGHTRHYKQGTGQQRMPGSGTQSGEGTQPGKQRTHKGCTTNGNAAVGSTCHQHLSETQSQDGCYGAQQEGHPITTELNTETSAGQSASDGHHPGCIVAGTIADVMQVMLKLVERIVLADGSPRESAHLGDGCKVDGMVQATAELGERMGSVAVIDLQHLVVDHDVQIVLVQAEPYCHTLHIPQHAGSIGTAFHQQATCLQQQIEPAHQSLPQFPGRLQVFGHLSHTHL